MLALLFANNTLGETIKVKEIDFNGFKELKKEMKELSKPSNVFSVSAQWDVWRMTYFKHRKEFVQYYI